MSKDRGVNTTNLLMQIVLTLMIVVLAVFIPLIIWIGITFIDPKGPTPTAAAIAPAALPKPSVTPIPVPTDWATPPPATIADATRAVAGQRIIYESDPANFTYDTILANQFTRDTGIQVDVSFFSDSSDENYKRYKQLFQEGSAAFDVLLMDIVWTGEFAPHLVDLQPELGQAASEHYDSIVANNFVNGRMIAMPLFGNFGLLYYRSDLLEKYGFKAPPATWQELTSMAQQIQDGERQAGRAKFTGFVFQGQEYEGLACNALEWIASNGGAIVEEGQVKLNSPEALEMLTLAQSWPSTISQGVGAYREQESLNVFKDGNAAFMRNWPYAQAILSQADAPVNHSFAVAALPAGAGHGPVGTVGGGQLGVSANSAHPQAAIAFVRYMTSPQVQTWRAIQGSFVPTIRSVAQDPQVIKAMPFLKSAAGVARVTRPSGAARQQYQDVSSTFYHGVSQILRGDDVAQVLRQLETDLREKLRTVP